MMHKLFVATLIITCFTAAYTLVDSAQPKSLLRKTTHIQEVKHEEVKQEEVVQPEREVRIMELSFYTTAPDEGSGTGITASGAPAVVGRTVACNSLPFGTRVIIEGREYVVEDTGNLSADTIDVLVATKDEAFQRGRYKAAVTILR